MTKNINMKLKSYLWGMRVGTFFALAGWLFVISYFDPEKSGTLGHSLFYFSSLLFFFGAFSWMFAWIRKKLVKNEEEGQAYAIMNLRQGFLLSVLMVTLLFFQSKGILVWWSGLLSVAGVFLIELYFLSRRK